jgi:hypothetical protein
VGAEAGDEVADELCPVVVDDGGNVHGGDEAGAQGEPTTNRATAEGRIVVGEFDMTGMTRFWTCISEGSRDAASIDRRRGPRSNPD